MHETDGGFSTLGMVVALLVTLSLIFSTAQVYRVMSASADVQDVADAAALAAENEVAEFMIVVRVCDAAVLSLSLTGLTSLGLGIAALCTPVTAAVGDALINFSTKIFKARTQFATKAKKGLNALQKALPYLAAAQAASVCVSNSGSATGSNYLGIALLVDETGDEIEIPDLGEQDELAEEATEESAEIKEAAARADEAAQEANEAKQIAFDNDCGNVPGYCMYERAESLAGLSGTDNPLYHSIDTWSFSVPLARARAYYAARLQSEQWSWYSTVREQANSALRVRFYQYAVEKMAEGYVYETSDAFSAYFPLMPRNNTELRETYLYTEYVYPVTATEDGQLMMHAFYGCPGAAGAFRTGSIAELEWGGFTICPSCGFQVQSMGHIAAATTSTDSGFEHYYVEVAEQAERYAAAKAEQYPASQQVKSAVSALLDECRALCEQAADCRIDAKPPGSYGAIALVVDTTRTTASTGFDSSFVSSSGTLGARAAVSGATLIEEASSEGRSVLSSLLDGLEDDAGIAAGAAGIVLDVWSALLFAYAKGQDAVDDAIEGVIGLIPFASASGLGTWASKCFRSLMEELGLQPAELDALKPVTVSTEAIALEGSGGFATRFLVVQRSALAISSGGTELFSSVVSDIERKALNDLGVKNGKVELVTIEPLGSGGPSIPITITLPSSVVNAGSSLVERARAALRKLPSNATKGKSWK